VGFVGDFAPLVESLIIESDRQSMSAKGREQSLGALILKVSSRPIAVVNCR
jgi:hypothetical protein